MLANLSPAGLFWLAYIFLFVAVLLPVLFWR